MGGGSNDRPSSARCRRSESRPSVESITDRAAALGYAAVVNGIFTLVAGLLMWLTISRGATDAVCGMRVDRQLTEHAEARASSARQALQGIPSRPERYA
jgi:hypothetical protein